ncbi:MAG: hypothetical protein M3004_12780 [Bacteroidota bacterium]|nr:hypothetical protein [Bacteroidota bacterium]
MTSLSQTKADSISLTFPKVLIVNNKKEILLAFDDNRKAYEVPSIGTMDGPISIKSYIDKTAKRIGITYKSFRLGGIFTYIFPDKYRTLIRPYFVVQFRNFSNGQNFSDTSYKWFSLDNALKKIPYPASTKIIKKILAASKNVWAATFEEYGYTNPVDKSKIKFKIVEDFYKLNQ